MDWGTEWVAPTITGILAVPTALIGGYFLLKNRRAGNAETRAPSVNDAWDEATAVRRRFFVMEDLFYELRGAFKAYARRTQERCPEMTLTEEEKTILSTDPPPPPSKA